MASAFFPAHSIGLAATRLAEAVKTMRTRVRIVASALIMRKEESKEGAKKCLRCEKSADVVVKIQGCWMFTSLSLESSIVFIFSLSTNLRYLNLSIYI